MPESERRGRPEQPDSRLVTGAYLTRRDGGGGLFEVLAILWERNFGRVGGHIGTAILEDVKSGEQVAHSPLTLLKEYSLVRPAASMET